MRIYFGFFSGFFWGIFGGFFRGSFLEDFLERIFLGGLFGEEFFGRNCFTLLKSKALICL